MKSNGRRVYTVGIAAFLVGLLGGGFLFGNLLHESSHALACLLFGLPYLLSWGQVVYARSPDPLVNFFVRLAGGAGQASFSLLLFWYATMLEKRVLIRTVQNLKRSLDLSMLFGFELAFLTIAFHGIITGIVESLFYQSYLQTYDNFLIWGTIVLICGITSFVILYERPSRLLK